MSFTKSEQKQVGKKSEASQSISINDLPKEILASIFSFLKPEQKSNASKVSKFWNSVSSDNALWKPHCDKLHIDVDDPSNAKSYKNAYIKKVVAERNDTIEKPNVYYLTQITADITKLSDLKEIKLKPNTTLYRNKLSSDYAMRSTAMFHAGPGDLYYVIYELHITDKQLTTIVFDEHKDFRKNTSLKILNRDAGKLPKVEVTAVYAKRPFIDGEYTALENENNKGCVIA